MLTQLISRSARLSLIFAKEQMKEPTAFFWILLSPSAVFYLFSYSRGLALPFSTDYVASTSWFYAYIASSVAFFGFSFYIIGRRESGFVRSFIYKMDARLVFLLSQLFAYSCISILYCLTFYCLTRPAFGPLDVGEALQITTRFYVCFLLFCIPGLLLTLLPITFQHANTCFSVASFSMLIAGIYSTSSSSIIAGILQISNPLSIANGLIQNGTENNQTTILAIIFFFLLTLLLTLRTMRVNPVWSRY